MKTRISVFFLIITSLCLTGNAQDTFTRQDSLRGSITPQRAWWDLQSYHLKVSVDIENRSISGSNVITYKVVDDPQDMQIDLQDPLIIDKVVWQGKEQEVTHEGSAHFVKFSGEQALNSTQSVEVFYHGVPHVAERAPWDGGFSWSEDENGNPFVATSNQGIGASIWWPCKDHPKDEPDNGVTMSFTVPKDLMAVGNGRLINTKKKKGMATYTWEVTNPINSYGVNLNIGDYVRFSELYDGEKGELDMVYYVLSYNLDKAKEHFKDARRTIEAFEHWFGPYPFYEDSYKLVEVPYLGMEHQSSVTYGNGYQLGYRGRDLSLSGWGLKWDYIIIHETGHEWFANNITYQDAADMWVHESFTTYSESLFIDYHYGKEAGAEYVRGSRIGIQNRKPMIGPYGVNGRGGDLYSKGANVLHTLRTWLNDDEKWRNILRGLNEEFYHATVTTADVENYIAEQSGQDLSAFFEQYLRTADVPVLEYFVYEGKLMYRWTNCLSEFNMPVRVMVDGEEQVITPTAGWNFRNAEIEVNDINSVSINPNYYIYPVFVTGNE